MIPAKESSDLGQKQDLDDSSRLCRVCSDRSDGAHFGIDSCRACAAFFRRSVVLGKKYVCRQGANQCIINKSVRCMCRKCRLRKCLESGMLPESVQSKRDPIVPRRTDPEPLGVAPEPASSSENELVLGSQSAFHIVQQSPSSCPLPPDVKTSELPHLLLRISANYKQLCSVRRSTELATNNISIRGLFENPADLSCRVPATCTSYSQSLRSSLPATSEFITQTFEEFSQFDQDEKWAVFRAFLVFSMSVEGPYRSYKNLTPEQNSSINLCTETMFIDLNNLEHFLSDTPMPKIRILDLSRFMKKCFDRPRQNMLKLMAKIQIQDEEFAALMALGLFHPNAEEGSDKIDNISSEMRSKIYQQLHIFYRLNNIDNYSERMGELMCLLSCVVHIMTRMKEDMELFNLLDVFSQDSFIYDLVRR